MALQAFQAVVNSLGTLMYSSIEGEFPENIVNAYRSTDPLAVAVLLVCAYAMYAWLGSIFTGDCSYVDRMWSIVPVLYAWNFALHPAKQGDRTRSLIIAVLLTVWGGRLTFNFWRKGGYSGEEDYRWPIIRKRMNRFLFQVFNFVFIAWIQHILLMAITVPSYVARLSSTPLNWIDALAIGLLVAFLVLETVADQQQWKFQTEKYARKAAKRRLDGDYARGFLTSGLFRYSRHPNFFAEQSIWCCVYLFSVAATGQWVNWSITGAAFLILLFQGSTYLTEQLSAGKYPLYLEYQKITSRFLPLPPSGEMPTKGQ